MPLIQEEPLNKYDPSTFRFTKCKTEVSQAMQEDWKHDKVDDAKKRAIYDSRNYDEFKARVAGCTLKPIHRNEFNAPPKHAFNRSANATRAPGQQAQGASSGPVGAMEQAGLPQPGKAVIKTGREFDRELRRCSSPEDKVALLLRLEDGDFARLFGRELDAEVLRQLILALDTTLGSAAAPLGSAQRFFSALVVHCPSSAATAASFLINEERAAVARLLARESRSAGGAAPADNVRVCAALGVPPQMLDAAVAQVEQEPPAPQGQGAGADDAPAGDREVGAESEVSGGIPATDGTAADRCGFTGVDGTAANGQTGGVDALADKQVSTPVEGGTYAGITCVDTLD
uniref:Dynein attachment factor N-terminal domain-containing protein n=1 Tax=Alexandrium monilatum TaxID=311494 RepID=A0A7S4Q3U2_9DINO|mmetsp:Transcript_28844/g.90960  ORF Transcript_28844/g.90960 Transcript_28844/m.90960 type:complete len:344 (-) Transcript_28844:78-1109(-)